MRIAPRPTSTGKSSGDSLMARNRRKRAFTNGKSYFTMIGARIIGPIRTYVTCACTASLKSDRASSMRSVSLFPTRSPSTGMKNPIGEPAAMVLPSVSTYGTPGGTMSFRSIVLVFFVTGYSTASASSHTPNLVADPTNSPVTRTAAPGGPFFA